MHHYLHDRVYGDALAAIAKARSQQDVPHNGLKGRFREIVITDLLRPWLPPTCACGTGTIICGMTAYNRESTQDDIVIYDKSIMPPVLIGDNSSEGVFLYNGVLCRLEVKSQVKIDEIRKFFSASVELAGIKLTKSPEQSELLLDGAMNMLMGFGTDIVTGHISEFNRFFEISKNLNGYEPGMVSAVCIIGTGLWMLRPKDGKKIWHRLETSDEAEQLTQFVSLISSTAFREHLKRNGVNWRNTLASGIGLYVGESANWLPCE